jgi:hypothetical protein
VRWKRARQKSAARPRAGPSAAAQRAAVTTAAATASRTARASASPRTWTSATGCEKRAQSVVSRLAGAIARRNCTSVITAYLVRSSVPPTDVSR